MCSVRMQAPSSVSSCSTRALCSSHEPWRSASWGMRSWARCCFRRTRRGCAPCSWWRLCWATTHGLRNAAWQLGCPRLVSRCPCTGSSATSNSNNKGHPSPPGPLQALSQTGGDDHDHLRHSQSPAGQQAPAGSRTWFGDSRRF